MGTETIPSKYNWNFTGNKVITKDKKLLIDSYIRYMLNRTQRMFEYKGLPETLPQRQLELYLQCYRFVIITKVDDKFYAFFGGLGGIPNEYYLPTIAIVSNPYLKFFKTLDITDDTNEVKDDNGNMQKCVVLWNDTSHIGLLPMFEKYASLLAETDISLRIATVNTRIPSLISADNDQTKASAEKFLEKVEEGDMSGIIAGSNFFKGIVTAEYGNKSTSNIKDLIELKQYLIASWYNDLGLQANYNMKREAINDAEAGMNEDALLPLIDDMLEKRREGLEQINKVFGLNITVDLSSSWKQKREQIVQSNTETSKVQEGGTETDETKRNDNNDNVSN